MSVWLGTQSPSSDSQRKLESRTSSFQHLRKPARKKVTEGKKVWRRIKGARRHSEISAEGAK